MSPLVHRRSPIRRRSPDYSDSPVQVRSPRRRSLPRKERSPARHRSSPMGERSPVRHRSSPRPRSPVRTGSSHRTRSPPREKNSARDRSPKYAKSISPVSKSPSPRSKRLRQAHVEKENSKAERGRSTSSASQSPSPHTKHLKRAQAERHIENVKESKKSASPVSHSPSPRTKRLRRAQAECEADKAERDHERHHSRDGDKGRHRERGVDKELSAEKRLTRDKNEAISSRSRETRHGRSNSPGDRAHKGRYSSHSPSRTSKTAARDEESRARGAERRDVEYDDPVSRMKVAEEALEAKEKQKPSFELSGKLAAETNRVRGVTLLFNEPPDARKPDVRWRLYVFKAGEVLNEPLYVHRQSCYLFGRERRVADVPTDHPSCSKQHAVIQFRLVEKELPDGMMSKQVRPYIMDLGSTNGTFINDNRIEPQRYYELFEKDTIKFGNSSREYVLLHENSVE